jgi:hypothetical protein
MQTVLCTKRIVNRNFYPRVKHAVAREKAFIPRLYRRWVLLRAVRS